MSESALRGLEVVDATELDDDRVEVLRPGEMVTDHDGIGRRLPRYFYEVPSWDVALETRITPHFSVWEFLDVDLREAAVLRDFPRYLPLAVTIFAAHLEVIRRVAGTFVHIAANGGYRSPGHRLSTAASPHMWGTAANIHRIGDDDLDREETVARYTDLARSALPSLWIRPFGTDPGQADDHLHIDIGFVPASPREIGVAPDEGGEQEEES